MSEELKSCPFCGKSDIHIEQKGTFFWCECYDCGAIGRLNVLQSEDIARGYWNQRPLEDALHTRIAELEAAQRWIPVSERMPDNWESVLTIDISKSTRDMVTAFYNPEKSLWSTHFSCDLWVTHWMPLPESPIVYGKEREE